GSGRKALDLAGAVSLLPARATIRIFVAPGIAVVPIASACRVFPLYFTRKPSVLPGAIGARLPIIDAIDRVVAASLRARLVARQPLLARWLASTRLYTRVVGTEGHFGLVNTEVVDHRQKVRFLVVV